MTGPARSLLIGDDRSIDQAVQLLMEEATSLFARRVAGQPEWWVDRELVASELLRARADRVPVRFQCAHPAPGGWVEVVAIPSSDGLALSIWDISERKQAEAALAESEACYRDLFEDAPIGYQELDLEGRFVRVNRTQLVMLGYAEDEVIGRHIWDFQWVHGEDPAETRRKFFEKMTSGRLPTTFERVRVRKDGTPLPVLVEDRFIRDASGAITGLRSTMLDITRRKAWEGAQARLAAIVESSHDAIIGKTLDGIITSWNPGAMALYGYAPEEVLGRPVSLLIPPEQADELPAILARLRRGERIEPFETRRIDKDGRRLDVSVTISPIAGSGGEIIGASAIARDISERKRADALLAGERRALALVARGASLADILDLLCRMTQDLAGEGLLASILLLDADGAHVRHGAAPDLPDEYLRAIDGTAIGPRAGSCGTAAYRRERVVVEDIANDPLWADFRDLALGHGLGACWSTPIFGSSGRVIGTFALYYREARAPRAEHLALIEAVARTAAIVIERKQIELALERSEERFRVALAPAPIIVAEQDAELRYTWIYDPASRFSGRDAVGKTDADLFPPSVSAPLTRLKRRVIRTARGLRREVRTAVAGQLSTFDLTLEPIVVDGAVVGITSAAIDVTERKALEEQLSARRRQAEALARDRALERDRLQQVIDGLPEAIIIGTADGSFLMNNRVTTELLGIDLAGVRIPFGDEEAVVARRADGSPARGAEMPLQRSILGGEVVRAEQWLCRRRPDGRDIPILMSSAPLYDREGTITGGVAVFQDITVLKELEREKDDFLASAAHDLRNPLTSIKGYAELLRRHVARSEHPDRNRLDGGLSQILISGQRMSDLIDQVLDLSRLQMGRPLELQPQRVDLVALVREIAAASDQMSEQHAVTVDCSVPEMAGVWDAARLERAVQNLVSNAIKFSPVGGDVTITLARESTADGPQAVLTVRDHGLGIPADDLPRLFTRFYRAGNAVGKVAGTGLGLASVRQVAEGHGGTVDVESTLGQGSVFTLRLPLEG